MFTGIVEEMGVVNKAGEHRLCIAANIALEGMKVGDSIAVNGACLTMTSILEGEFVVDLSPETLKRTNLGALKIHEAVNLERPLRLDARLGGHITQGHVDATGIVVSMQPEGRSVLMSFEPPASMMRYIVEKGFITVDGVSLTIADRGQSTFTVSVIPITRRTTNLGIRKLRDRVNLEVDIIAKYVEAMLCSKRDTQIFEED